MKRQMHQLFFREVLTPRKNGAFKTENVMILVKMFKKRSLWYCWTNRLTLKLTQKGFNITGKLIWGGHEKSCPLGFGKERTIYPIY
jgi:hypothetical protein